MGPRALHLDGLAETADGLGWRRDRAHALEIMRAGDIGWRAGSGLPAGGITGDVIGAAVELSWLVLLLVMAL